MPIPIQLLAAVFGAAAAAFLPRVAYRLAVPFGAPPRSACAVCARPFPPGPGGWVRAGAACPCTGRPWLTVLSTAAAAGLLGATPVLIPAAVLGVLLALIDLRCLRLPDRLVAVLAVLIVVPGTVPAVAGGEPGRAGFSALVALLVGSAYLLIFLFSGGGLGFGDVKLAAVLGFALGQAGWPAVLLGVVLPQLINGPVAAVLLLTRRAGRRTALPFGPALLAGALIAVTAT